ncbi:hypothetical protein CPC08DRAFT_705445 [Agrocybe pediades]|nr:hypothetical protein CPC08DRAFT_705445 [Agrocybe pediades]
MAGFSHHNPALDRETIGLSRERDINPMFVLKLTIFSASSSPRDALWINACAILPLTWVRTVYWSCLPTISAETINSCFGTLQNLNCMLFRCTYPDFYKILRATLPSPEGTCPKSVFPELRMITLNDFVLYGEHLSNLIDLLIQRYEGGSEVQRLVLLNCLGVDDEEIDLLREVVVDVFWDGTVRKLDGNQVDMDDYYYYNWFY